MIVKNVEICQSDNSHAVFHSSWNSEEHKTSFHITEISRMLAFSANCVAT